MKTNNGQYDVDVIIPTFNNKNELSECLASLDRQTFRSFFVHICVDGSTDNTIEWLSHQPYTFDFTIHEHADHGNHGRAAARNLGLQNVSAPYVILLDSDVIAQSNLLAAHLSFIKKWEGISVGDIRFDNSQENIWAYYLQQRGKHRYAHGKVIPPQYFVTQNVAFPSLLIEKTGLMDEAIKGYGGDDLDYGVRLVHDTHWKCRYNIKASVHAEMNKNLETALTQLHEFGFQSLPYLLKKFDEYQDSPDLFKIHLSKKKWVYSKIWKRLSEVMLYFPFFIAKYGVHYLVFYNVVTGFKKYHGTAHSI